MEMPAMSLSELTKDIEPWKLKGLKIATVGLVVTILGFLLFLADLKIVGRVVLYCGFMIGFAGIFVHIYLLFKVFMNRK